ncbi:dTDP-4-dehydrorhamnose reductase family protein [Methylorubrum extorquens]|uniref:dTDP-4-dehydrorhamnose reductase family protein n=1 Tax=Methylorubrum extorquens TaxID=408 RepID=UPI000158F6BD|nr:MULTISPECIES: SDR family oxidoreductase [Methylobacteriaceae]ABY32089.1 dTDP-4-dehydrorhamnose reductase [Methylorubrum extorquens PA1]KQP95217.1 NAD(P)-dependent oxidoreductase [Methylobacterium sp. Leaf119]KQQ23162.1 NAD(P)-dependent oxidoreductase [Methylobacterium sp. Leaf122]WIU38696.1 SDR family oxidoreductase [Methylorubrum extorquens]
MKIAVLGASGMLGSAAFQYLSDRFPGSVYATARSPAVKNIFPESAANITIGIDVENADALAGFLREVRPDVVVNCVGVVKQLSSAEDPLVAIPINAILPHRLARLADLVGARLIHISTDCVFTGRKGDYRESDVPDAEDLYGRSKLLGEVDYPNAVTLRTSIIGREFGSRNGLVEWFLSQSGSVRGYRRAIFSGLTTDELVRVIADRVLPNPDLRGVYHVSVAPISKFDLLGIVRDVYGVGTEIEPDDAVAIDRSLNSDRFRGATGYVPPSWPDLIRSMRRFDEESFSQVR